MLVAPREEVLLRHDERAMPCYPKYVNARDSKIEQFLPATRNRRLRFDGLTRCPQLSEIRSRYTLENSQVVQLRYYIASQR